MARGLRLRILIDSLGQKMNLMIRRLYCPKCGRIHHEIPDCVVPYKRHCAETIEKIIEGKIAGASCENRTVRRIQSWWKIVMLYFMNIIKSLAQKHRIEFRGQPAFREMVRAAVNSNNWIFANSICTRSACEPG